MTPDQRYRQAPLWEIQPPFGKLRILSSKEKVFAPPSRFFGRGVHTTAAARHIAPQWHAALADARVLNPSWAVVDQSTVWQQEPATELPYFSAGYSEFFSKNADAWQFKRAYSEAAPIDEAALIWHRTGFNYFHALFEILPKILMLDSIDPQRKIPALVDTQAPANIRSIVTHFLAGRPQCELSRDQMARVRLLHCFSSPAHMPDDPQFDIRVATVSPRHTAAVSRRLKKDCADRIGLLFVSRLQYQRRFEPTYNVRNVTNHELLDTAVQASGALTVFPEDLSWQEQQRLFASADRIVMVAGGACANLIFCRPGTKLLCLANSKGANFGFMSTLWKALGIDGAWLLGAGDGADVQDSFRIDERDLARGMAWLLDGSTDFDGTIAAV
jgi:capsular polysaccharide biosynthesis protein